MIRLSIFLAGGLALGCGCNKTQQCTSTAECDDGVYCNGYEICDPAAPGADARGCAKGAPVSCLGVGNLTCSNTQHTCVNVCSGSFFDLVGCLQPCRTASDCGDATAFCTGALSCVTPAVALTLPNAEANGCVHAPPPCQQPQQGCSEALRQCVESCGNPDADGDGVKSIQCGGTDCDDNDPMRAPGRTEVCDSQGHDEDCDPTTYGFRDRDHDGYVDALCCNGTNCGPDCNDMDRSIHPDATEVCNHIDDSCVGVIDDRIQVSLYADHDGDGYGAGPAVMGCVGDLGYSLLPNDCDDTNPAITPGAEICLTDQGPAVLAICQSDGGYAQGKCMGQDLCHPQANGLGICIP